MLKLTDSAGINTIKFDQRGLVPAIIQSSGDKQVLMLAYMNKESLQKTLQSGETWFWSRSRSQLWHKGETSGHKQLVEEIFYDCDADTLLLTVEQIGAACHTGSRSCFFSQLAVTDGELKPGAEEIISFLSQLLASRRQEMPEGSYTTYLFEKGLDKILKKVGEETAEVIIAAKNTEREELIYETADLIYHLMVLLQEKSIDYREVLSELAGRYGDSNNEG